MNKIIEAARNNFHAQQARKAAKKEAKQMEKELETAVIRTKAAGIKVIEDEEE